MPNASPVTVLPIVSTNAALPSVTIGDVKMNYASQQADANCTHEWWPALNDVYSLLDVNNAAFLAPVGQAGAVTWPAITATEFTIAAGKNGLLSPFADTAIQTTMLVVKRPASGSGVILGNYTDVGDGSTGVYLYWAAGSVYLGLRGGGADVNLNAPSQGTIAVGDWVFIYLSEDASSILSNFGGSTNPIKTLTTGVPKTLSPRNYSVGNRYISGAGYLVNPQSIAWIGRATTKLSSTEIGNTYTRIKAKLALLGITVK